LIINRVQSVYPHIRISLPRINDETGELESIFFEAREQLVLNKWGIPQPRQGKKTRINEIDMVLVPLLILINKVIVWVMGKGTTTNFFPPAEWIVNESGFPCLILWKELTT